MKLFHPMAAFVAMLGLATPASAEFDQPLSRQTTGAVGFQSPAAQAAALNRAVLMDRIRDGRDGNSVRTTVNENGDRFTTITENCGTGDNAVCDRSTTDQSSGDRLAISQRIGTADVTIVDSAGATVDANGSSTNGANDADQWSLLQECANCPPLSLGGRPTHPKKD